MQVVLLLVERMSECPVLLMVPIVVLLLCDVVLVWCSSQSIVVMIISAVRCQTILASWLSWLALYRICITVVCSWQQLLGFIVGACRC